MTGFEDITIRRARGADAEALERLAQLDSKRLPSDEFLIAEVAGEPIAALAIGSGTVVADPFRPTADVTELLRLHLDGRANGGGRRWVGRLGPRVALVRQRPTHCAATCA